MKDYLAGFEPGIERTPRPEHIGSWWKRAWEFKIESGRTRLRTAPAPPDITIQGPLVVTFSWQSENTLFVIAYSKTEALTDGQIAYIAKVAAWIRERTGGDPFTINGDSPQAILRFADMNRLGVSRE